MGCARERVNGNADFIHEKMEIKTLFSEWKYRLYSQVIQTHLITQKQSSILLGDTSTDDLSDVDTSIPILWRGKGSKGVHESVLTTRAAKHTASTYCDHSVSASSNAEPKSTRTFLKLNLFQNLVKRMCDRMQEKVTTKEDSDDTKTERQAFASWRENDTSMASEWDTMRDTVRLTPSVLDCSALTAWA